MLDRRMTVDEILSDTKAYKKLRAAAPDLLIACRLAHKCLNAIYDAADGDDDMDAAMAKLEHAMFLAEGEAWRNN